MENLVESLDETKEKLFQASETTCVNFFRNFDIDLDFDFSAEWEIFKN